MIRKFSAKEITPEPTDDTIEDAVEDDRACAVCRRRGSWLVLGPDERWWCSEAESAACTRIAQGRLGGVTTASHAALSGTLRSDGKCRACKEPVRWVKTQRGRKMPVDVRPAVPGVAAFELVGEVNTLAFYVSEKKRPTFSGDVYESHFQTCEARDGD
jgi:hypothetical protein